MRKKLTGRGYAATNSHRFDDLPRAAALINCYLLRRGRPQCIVVLHHVTGSYRSIMAASRIDFNERACVRHLLVGAARWRRIGGVREGPLYQPHVGHVVKERREQTRRRTTLDADKINREVHDGIPCSGVHTSNKIKNTSTTESGSEALTVRIEFYCIRRSHSEEEGGGGIRWTSVL